MKERGLTVEEEVEMDLEYYNFISLFKRRNYVVKDNDGYWFSVYEAAPYKNCIFNSDHFKTTNELNQGIKEYMDFYRKEYFNEEL